MNIYFIFALVCSLTEGSTVSSSQATPPVPREFPNFNQNYTFVDNSSIWKNLASHAGIDTEVGDLLVEVPPEQTKSNEEPDIEEETLERKSDTEWVEDGTQTVLPTDTTQPGTSLPTSTTGLPTITNRVAEFEKATQDGVGVIDGTLAAILVGVFLVIAVLGYVALILWRRSLELKYGSREMLVDKDEIFDPDDLKHFSI